jgi:hypothetical protein
MRKSHECHSEPQAKNLAFTGTYKSEILRLSPQDDIATQSLKGEGNFCFEEAASVRGPMSISRGSVRDLKWRPDD